MSQSPHGERNRTIYERRLNGATFAELGREYGISSRRVTQIFDQQARRTMVDHVVEAKRGKVVALRNEGHSVDEIREILRSDGFGWISTRFVNQVLRENPQPHCPSCTCFSS